MQQHEKTKFDALKLKKAKQKTLKEKLIESRLQRNQLDMLEREERMRPMQTFFPYSK